MSKTKIEWTEFTWSPVTGCTKVGPGCKHCFAERMARRLAGRYGYPGAPNHFDVTLHSSRLEQPLKWRKPRRIFVCSMSDLFHEDVPFAFIAKVFDVMAYSASHHTYQILTKRPGRMKAFIHAYESWYGESLPGNIWLGVSVENQAAADERRECLRLTPAAVKFISYEPALGPVDWTGWEFVDQIISGGESGPQARPSHPDWHRGTRDFCQVNGIAYFMKQWGAWIPFGQGKGEKIPREAKECWLDIRGQLLPANPTYSAMMHKPSKLFRIGKKRAGRTLDGVLHEEYPQQRAP